MNRSIRMIVLCLIATSFVASCDTKKDDEEYFQKFFTPNLVPAFAKKVVANYHVDLKGPNDPIVAGRFMHNLDDLSMRAMQTKANVGDGQDYHSSNVVQLAMRMMVEDHTDAKLIKAGYALYGDMLLRSIREVASKLSVVDTDNEGHIKISEISEYEVELMMKAFAQDLRTRATTLRSVIRLYETHQASLRQNPVFYEQERIASTDNCRFRKKNSCFGAAQQIHDNFEKAVAEFMGNDTTNIEDFLWGMRRAETYGGLGVLTAFVQIFENAAHSIDSNTYLK